MAGNQDGIPTKAEVGSVSRRQVLGKMAVAGSVAWVAPVVFTAPAYAVNAGSPKPPRPPNCGDGSSLVTYYRPGVSGLRHNYGLVIEPLGDPHADRVFRIHFPVLELTCADGCEEVPLRFNTGRLENADHLGHTDDYWDIRIHDQSPAHITWMSFWTGGCGDEYGTFCCEHAEGDFYQTVFPKNGSSRPRTEDGERLSFKPSDFNDL